jgi:hypothetical protein
MGMVVFKQKKAARTVVCSCREASDATCISRNVNFRLNNLYGRKPTLPLKEIYHNMDVENGKYVQS